ncbi:hypothetical protein [Micromonospora sp. NPDC048169]|uniref:hypothetical protein n=1 Tax=Micromonospora sp. NPDC048169 TaxID=3154711 RepID=UPI0033FE140F
MSTKYPYEESYRRFLPYVEKHEMNVLHDDGLYRHIQFGVRGAVGWFELATWPGRLAITGDIGGWVFGRVGDDLFDFFARQDGAINPHYWAEKIVAGGPTEEFSADLFISNAVEYFWSRRDQYQGEMRDLFREIRLDVLDYDEDEAAARNGLETFRYTPKNGGRDFIFRDSWEWNLTDLSVHYLRACHAIVWGINRYRQAVKS